MKLKIFGERNSGTQFLRETLRLNGPHDLWPGTIAELGLSDQVAAAAPAGLPDIDAILLREALIDDLFATAFESTLGWKHGAPALDRLRAAAGDTTFLIAVKNPYAWVASMYRRPYHNLLTGNMASLETFLITPWLTCGRDNLPRRVESVVELWNQKYRAWLRLGETCPSLVVRYEDLLLGSDPLRPLARAVGQSSAEGWRLPVTVRNNGDDRGFYTDYYAHERWRATLSPATIALIGERLDHGLVAALGYTLLAS